MKIVKKIIAILLVMTTVVTTLSACGKNGQPIEENSAYITKGTFFQMAMYKMQLYGISNTDEDFDNATDSKIFAQLMVDWGLQTEDEAFKKLNDVVTKDTVVNVCIRNMYFTKKGNPDEIKDARKCSDPQAAADAVATGLVELNNGYFEANRKMTYDECDALIEKSIEINTSGSFEDEAVDGDTGMEFSEDTGDFEILDSNDIDPSTASVHRNDEEDTTNVSYDITNGAKVTPLGTDTLSPEITEVAKASEDGYFEISKASYDKNKSKFTVGKKFSYSTNEDSIWEPDNAFADNGTAISEPIAVSGTVSSVTVGIDSVRIYFFDASEEETSKQISNKTDGKVKKINLNNNTIINAINKMTGGESGVLKELGIKIKASGAEKSKNGIMIEAEKTLKFNDFKFSGSQEWRNREITPTVGAKFQLYDVSLNYKKVGGLIIGNGNSEAYFSANASTSQTFSISSGELKYTPACNGNGKFPANWGNSRWTDAGRGGAQSIKICKVPIFGALLTGLYFSAYLTIKFDGSIEITTNITDSKFEIRNQGKGKKVTFSVGHITNEINIRAQIEASLDLGVEFDIASKCIANAVLKPILRVNADAIIQIGDEVVNIDTSEKELQEYFEANKDGIGGQKVSTCLRVVGRVRCAAQLCDSRSLLGRKLSQLGVEIKFESKEAELFNIHMDNGNLTDAETVIYDFKEDGVSYHKEGISLEQYAVTMGKGISKDIKISELPLSKKKLKEEYRGVRASTEDESIATISVSKDYSHVTITPKKAGTTNAVVYINKIVGDGKFDYKYKMTITVVDDVNGNKNKSTSFSNNLGLTYSIEPMQWVA